MESGGPIRLTRNLIQRTRSLGAVSIVYHYSHKYSSVSSMLPYLHFENALSFSRRNIPYEHAEVLGRCHEFIIRLGKPLVLSKFIHHFAAAEPALTKAIMSEAHKIGVRDQYMVPVFGPHDINGLIAFGFPQIIDVGNDELLQELESAAASHHNRMVRHFADNKKDIELSARENEVLTWIARGKSSSEIAIILGIKASSVDTYTRRIFEKMGVNDRVSAAVSGVMEGLVKPA